MGCYFGGAFFVLLFYLLEKETGLHVVGDGEKSNCSNIVALTTTGQDLFSSCGRRVK